MMASITIRNIEPDLKIRLRVRAASHGRSMEEEVRHILRQAFEAPPQPTNLADLADELFGDDNGMELAEHPPVRARKVPNLGVEH